MSTLASPSVQEQQFLEAFQQAIDTQKLDRVVLSQYKGELEQLEKITLRVIQLNQDTVLTCLYRHKTQDITKNYPLAEAQIQLSHLLADCKQANLFTTDQEIQLKKNKKKAMLSISKTAPTIAKPKEPQGHDREKQRYVDQSSPFLQHLGISDAKAQIIPSMARKWKQINKFIEIFSGALAQIKISENTVRVVDFGSGKGYLILRYMTICKSSNFFLL